MATPPRQARGRFLAACGTRRRPPTRAQPHESTSPWCPGWEQASHGGEVVYAYEAGLLGREDVTEIGAVLTGSAEGRRSPDDITAFDSTGLALQDLAIALAAQRRLESGELGHVQTIQL
jgi:hypothetical protein